MKKYITILILLAAFNADAQWFQTRGPERGFVHSIVNTSSGLYAGTYGGGIFRLTNARKNWFEVNNGLTCPDVNSLINVNSNLYAGTSYYGVFRSSNHGGNWVAVNDGLSNLEIMTLFSKDNLIYAGTASGLFLTTNNGANWSLMGLTAKTVRSVIVKHDTVYAGTDYDGLFRTTDNGQNWTAVNNGLSSNRVASLCTIGNYLFAGTGTGVFKSTNSGANWYYSGLSTQNYNFVIVKGNSIFASNGYGGLYKSTDYGTNWIQVFNGLSHLIHAIYTDGMNLYIGNEYGIYLSTDDGGTWTAINNCLTNELITSIAAFGPYIFAGTESNGIFKSSDEGLSWEKCGLDEKSVFDIATIGTKIFACTVLSGGIYVSTDYGSNWTAKNNGLTSTVILKLLVKGNNIFAGTDAGVFRSTNSGENWTLVNNGMTNNYIFALGANSTHVFAGSDNMQGDMFRSSDDGLTWTAINNGLTYKITRVILTVGSNIYAGTQSGVFFSSNNGDNWESIGLSNIKVYSLLKIGSNLLAGTTNGVFLYDAVGKTWLNMNQGFSIVPRIYCLFKSQNFILAGTEFQSVWRCATSDIVGINPVMGIIPESMFLYQNSPNPFNPVTKIRYALPRSSYVKLTVIDALGREIETLVNERQQAGTYEASFDASHYPSGIYFYRLTTDGYNETRKMMLIK